MSHTIEPIKWLASALWAFKVWDIFEITRSTIENEGDEKWTCNISFEIPLRNTDEVRHHSRVLGPPSVTKIGAQTEAVRLSLQQIEQAGYFLPDWSWMKMRASRQSVPRSSELHAQYNFDDVVRRL
jgi:hypothetical protein